MKIFSSTKFKINCIVCLFLIPLRCRNLCQFTRQKLFDRHNYIHVYIYICIYINYKKIYYFYIPYILKNKII